MHYNIIPTIAWNHCFLSIESNSEVSIFVKLHFSSREYGKSIIDRQETRLFLLQINIGRTYKT